ncbi:MAG: flagellar hook-associated protein FlgK, partial [Holophaga sp.]|nr:flagellar hook-associated protein FlgK [Holophaga sp.]
QDQRKQADGVVGNLVTEINAATIEIAKLNARIGAEPTPGADSDARDQRQGLINKLADLVGVQVFEDSKGQMQVTLDSGAAVLVSGITAYRLKATPDPLLGNFYRVDLDLGSMTVDITASVKEGAMGASLDLRDTLLPGFQQKLDELASGIGTQVNALHNPGFGLVDLIHRDFFTGLPAGVPGAANGIRVNTALTGDPRLVAAANVSGAVGNNETARAISKLYDSGSFGATVSSLTSSIGSKAQEYKNRVTSDENLMVALQNQHDRISGVDLDEEATQMMAFQRGYQASARFISVINQLTDQLVNQFGR